MRQKTKEDEKQYLLSFSFLGLIKPSLLDKIDEISKSEKKEKEY